MGSPCANTGNLRDMGGDFLITHGIPTAGVQLFFQKERGKQPYVAEFLPRESTSAQFFV